MSGSNSSGRFINLFRNIRDKIVENGISFPRLDAELAEAHAAHNTPLALQSAADTLRSKLSNLNALKLEFAALNEFQDELDKEHDMSVGTAATDAHLNRYLNVLPYEHTRVKLNGSSDLDSYINASLVRLGDTPCEGTPSEGTTWQYIVTQGPLPHTTLAFWLMIFESKARAIVMLTDFIENKRRKCHDYFPTKVGQTKVVSPELRVTVLSVAHLAPYGIVYRKFRIQQIHDSTTPTALTPPSTWECDHFHFVSWPDHGVPHSPLPLVHLLSMLRHVDGGMSRSILMASSASSRSSPPTRADNSPTSPPVVVHCSAGIGRSGVFCVVDTAARRLLGSASVSTLEQRIECAKMAVDVYKMVKELRCMRGGMVQTEEQYVFCYKAILSLIDSAVEKLNESLKL